LRLDGPNYISPDASWSRCHGLPAAAFGCGYAALHCKMVKSCFLSKIFDAAFYLPARDLPVAALLVLRRRAVAADCPLPPAAFGCGYAALRLCGEFICE
jgi:hypothetical protein